MEDGYEMGRGSDGVTQPQNLWSLPVRLARGIHRLGFGVRRKPIVDPDDLLPSRRRQALLRLQGWHAQARDLVPATSLNANLEWILRPREDSNADVARFDEEMIGTVRWWVEDLAGKLVGVHDPEGFDEAATRRSVAGELRTAIDDFVLVFRRPARTKSSARRLAPIHASPESSIP